MPNFGSERGDALVGTNGKEKVIAAFHHPRQHLLYQAVVRIDQHVVSLEAIEVKNEGFRLTVSSLVSVRFHTADSVAAGVAACRLISSNVVLGGPLFSLNSVPKPRMLSVRAK